MKYFYKFLLLSFFLYPAYSIAQSNYKAGYIVELNGDTVKGFIDYRDWDKNPVIINFKKDANSKQKQSYTPATITSVEITGFDDYRKFILPVSQNRLEVASLTTNPDTTTAPDTAFLRILASGKNATLYVLRDNFKQRYFIGEKNARPEELIYRLYLDPEQPSNILTQNSFRLQLQRYAATYQPGNTKLSARIQRAVYDEKYLQPIIDEINGGNGQLQSSSRYFNRLFAGLAINYSRTIMEGQSEFANAKPSNTVLPALVFGDDYFINRNVGTVLIRTQLAFTYNRIKYSAVSFANSSDEYIATYKLNQFTIALNPNIVWNLYNKKAFKFYIEGGASLNYSLYGNKVYDHYYTQRKEDDPQTFINGKSAWISFPFKAGVVLNNRIDIYAGYIMPANITDNYIFIELKNTNYQAGINYLFGK